MRRGGRPTGAGWSAWRRKPASPDGCPWLDGLHDPGNVRGQAQLLSTREIGGERRPIELAVSVELGDRDRESHQEPHFRLGSGRDGGSRKAGGAVRSSALSGEFAAASLGVRAGRFHFCSTSLSTEVWSSPSLQT